MSHLPPLSDSEYEKSLRKRSRLFKYLPDSVDRGTLPSLAFDQKRPRLSVRYACSKMAQVARSKVVRFIASISLSAVIFWYIASAWMDPETLRSKVNYGKQLFGSPKECLPGVRPVQHVLMIDAGSQGSRIHVYEFDNCQGPAPVLAKEHFSELRPGLSYYADDPQGAAESLDGLLEKALEVVPESMHSCTPVAVKATAGLRRIGPVKADAILQAVEERLSKKFPFPILDQHGVEVMEGRDEGVYAWITINYLLGNIGGPNKKSTAAVFDLGGLSTQIVFEPRFPTPERLQEGEHKYELKFGDSAFELYQHSHLNFGLMAARERIHSQLIKKLQLEKGTGHIDNWMTEPVTNPCISSGMSVDVPVTLDGAAPDEENIFKMIGPATADDEGCRMLSQSIMNKTEPCNLSPCSFNGIHQPSLTETFAEEAIWIFSYFYDRTNPLGLGEDFTISDLHILAHDVCGGPTLWDSKFAALSEEARRELDSLPEWCLDLNYMVTLLETGYDLPSKRQVHTAKKLQGNELGWCLGASLPLLSGDSWTCRLREESEE